MAEFKIASALASEITTLRQAGAEPEIAVPETSGGTATLETCNQFVQEHAMIKALLVSYCNLVQKDASDLEQMMETAQQMDSKVADSY